MDSAQDKSKQNMAVDNLEPIYISELIEELEQCREDERASRNQMFAILGAVATFIAAVIGIAQIKDIQEGWVQNNLFINGLSTLVLCVTMPYLTNLGLLSCFRHFYIKDIEEELDNIVRSHKDREFFHWESISTPLITFNYKHILPGYSAIYNINMGISLASILLLASLYILFIQTLSPNLVFSTIGSFVFSVVFWMVALISAFTIFIASRCSKEIYDAAKEQAKSRRINPKNISQINKGVFKLILYLLYPRPTDIQKSIFFVVGVLFSVIVNYSVGKPNSPEETIAHLFFCWLVFDFLIYQARYQLNDLEGINQDLSHPGKELRKRLPIDEKVLNKTRTAKLSIIVAIFKLICSLVMLIAYIRNSTWRRVVAIGCMFFIIAISFAYEAAKRRENNRQVLFLVSIGYPIRVFVGMLCEINRLNILFSKDTSIFLTMILLLLGTAACGEFFVTLMWAHEGIYIKKKNSTCENKKFVFLFSKDNNINNRYHEQQPLLYRDSLSSIWNISLFLTYAFIGTAFIICSSNLNNEMFDFSIVFILVLLFITYSCGTGAVGKSIFKAAFLLISAFFVSSLLYLYLFRNAVPFYCGLVVFFNAILCFYSILYCSFRMSNYENLINFPTEINNRILMLLYKTGEVLLGEKLMILLGWNNKIHE